MSDTVRRRSSDAGVTLIEILVVLALFAITAGAVVLTVPSGAPASQTELDRLAVSARLLAVVDHALTTDAGFGIWQSEEGLVVLQQSETGRWVPATHPRLNPVKLSARHARISFEADDDRVFAVSATLVPKRGVPLRIEGDDGTVFSFDGLKVTQLVGEQPVEDPPSR